MKSRVFATTAVNRPALSAFGTVTNSGGIQLIAGKKRSAKFPRQFIGAVTVVAGGIV
jgi:hypothetical protein